MCSRLDGVQRRGHFLVAVQRRGGARIVACNPRDRGCGIGHDGVLGVDGGHRAVGKDQLVELVDRAGGHRHRLVVGPHLACELQLGASGQHRLGVIGPSATHIDQVHTLAQRRCFHHLAIGHVDGVDACPAGDDKADAGLGGGKGLALLAHRAGAGGEGFEHRVQGGTRGGCAAGRGRGLDWVGHRLGRGVLDRIGQLIGLDRAVGKHQLVLRGRRARGHRHRLEQTGDGARQDHVQASDLNAVVGQVTTQVDFVGPRACVAQVIAHARAHKDAVNLAGAAELDGVTHGGDAAVVQTEIDEVEVVLCGGEKVIVR